VTDEGEDWADFEAARFHPLADDDPDMTGRLSKRFSGRLAVGMTAEERTYAEELGPVAIDVGISPKGLRLLRLNFAGSEGSADWDGTESEAEELIDSEADRQCSDVGYDYWVHGGGWKQWNENPPSTP
jgi:hypothetical protein